MKTRQKNPKPVKPRPFIYMSLNHLREPSIRPKPCDTPWDPVEDGLEVQDSWLAVKNLK